MDASHMYLAMISNENIEKVAQFGVKLHLAFGNTFVIVGNETQAEKMASSGLVTDLIPHPFPLSPFKRGYEYLGDLPINVRVKMDLSLLEKSQGDRYWIEGDLPMGFVFSDGILEGTSREPTGILHFTLMVETRQGTLSKQYMLRFYEGKNRSRTFTDNDYIRVGFGPEFVDYDPSQVYYRLVPDALPSVTESPFEYAKAAARKIYASAGSKPIVLMVSGGIDSQCLMQSFLAAGVPFQAVFMRDKNNINRLDAHYLSKFVEKTGAPVQIIEEDFVSYIRSHRYLPMAYKYRFNNPEYGLLLSLMDKFPNAYPVYAGRPISVSSGPQGERVLGLCGDETWSKARYLERNGREGAVEFLIHTPELMASFLKLKAALTFPTGNDWLYLNKLDLLREGGFDISLAPPIKATGFEEFFKHFPETPYGNQIWSIHRGPLKSLFPNPPERNSILLKDGNIADDGLRLRRDYPDGFSYEYLTKHSCSMFH
jgi:hypothetical protein